MQFFIKLLSLISLFSFISYCFINANVTKDGGGGFQLLFSITTGLMIVILHNFNGKINFKNSFIWIFIFILYIIFRLFIDVNNFDEIKEFTLGTTRGFLLSFFVGIILSFCFHEITKELKSKGIWIFFLVFPLLYLYLLIELMGSLISEVRSDIFLLSDLKGGYQRAGIMLSLAFLILSTFILKYFYLFYNENRVFFMKFISIFVLLVYISISIIQAVLSQLIASNSSFLFTSSIFFITICYSLLTFFPKNIKRLRISLKDTRKYIWGVSWRPLIKSSAFAFFIVILLTIFLIYKFDFDVSKTRVMGYGGGENSSLTSRSSFIEKYYFTQLSYSPIYGDLLVDEITTGKGTYAHSFILATFSHLGIIGLILVLIFFMFSIHDLYNNKHIYLTYGIPNNYLDKMYGSYLLIIYIFIFSMASLTTFINWMPIWFTFGYILSPIYNNKIKK